jgi:hypothetical protein
MRGIDTHDEGAVTQAGEFEAGCGGKTGFPNASFAAEKKDAHDLILALSQGRDTFSTQRRRERRDKRRENQKQDSDVPLQWTSSESVMFPLRLCVEKDSRQFD